MKHKPLPEIDTLCDGAALAYPVSVQQIGEHWVATVVDIPVIGSGATASEAIEHAQAELLEEVEIRDRLGRSVPTPSERVAGQPVVYLRAWRTTA